MEKLLEVLKNEYGDCSKIIEGYKVLRVSSIRVNTLKTDVLSVCNKFLELGVKFDKVDWYEDALIIYDSELVRGLDLYKDGFIYFQSLSSMIPPLILNPTSGNSILDMAAAPGSKTTQMACMTNNLASITAVEKNKIRADRLKFNLSKQGAKRVTVLCEDARHLDEFFSFDKILLDAPCSGSGTISFNDSFDFELVSRSVRTQKELVDKAVKILKKDGELVYSTCSILKEENDDIVDYILSKGLELVEFDIPSSIPRLSVKYDETLCVCPNELYEGFFIAKFIKR